MDAWLICNICNSQKILSINWTTIKTWTTRNPDNLKIFISFLVICHAFWLTSISSRHNTDDFGWNECYISFQYLNQFFNFSFNFLHLDSLFKHFNFALPLLFSFIAFHTPTENCHVIINCKIAKVAIELIIYKVARCT